MSAEAWYAHAAQAIEGATKYKSQFKGFGAPGRIRTSDTLVRSQVLYPAELRARFDFKKNRSTMRQLATMFCPLANLQSMSKDWVIHLTLGLATPKS